MGFSSWLRMVPIDAHQAIVDDYENRLAALSGVEDHAKDMDRRLVAKEAEASRMGTLITDQRTTISNLTQSLNQTEVALMENRRQLLIREAEVKAMQSVPVWTREGRRWVRVQAGDNPVMPNDPLLTQLASMTARALSEELYRMAGGSNPNPSARMMIARSQPLPDIEAVAPISIPLND